jgi:hypothetical protein
VAYRAFLSMHLENNSNILFHSFCSIREVTQKWMVTIFVYGVGPIFRRHNRPKPQIFRMPDMRNIGTQSRRIVFNKQLIQTVSKYWNKTIKTYEYSVLSMYLLLDYSGQDFALTTHPLYICTKENVRKTLNHIQRVFTMCKNILLQVTS